MSARKTGLTSVRLTPDEKPGAVLSNSIERLAERAARGRFRLQLCSVIVHLHLNRHPLALGLPHPEQPVCAGVLCLGVSGVERKRLGEAGVHVKGRRVGHVGRDQTQVNPGRGLVRAPVELREGGTDDLPVVVDRGHAPHVAAVGDLIAVGVEAVAAAAVGDRLLAAAQVVHAPEGAGNALTRGVEADLAVHVNVQRILRRADGSAERLLLVEQVQKETGNVRDLLVILRFRHGGNGLVLRLGHDLAAQIGVFDLRDVGVTVEDALRFVQKGLELVLIAECFFQIHRVVTSVFQVVF